MPHSRLHVSRRRPSRSVSAVAALLVCALAGCTPFATAYWVLKDGNTAPPEYFGLKNKRVAVVCRGAAGHEFQRLEATIPQQISERVRDAIKAKLGRKVNMLKQAKIEQYSDEKEWDDFTELGRDLKVDRVLAIDIEELTIRNSGTVHQASLRFVVTVYDMEKDGHRDFEKMFEIDFPTEGGIASVSTISDRKFVSLLVNYVSRSIGELFYDHNPRETFGDHGV